MSTRSEDEAVGELEREIERSCANNSRLYRHFETAATLAEVVKFLHWDGVQPAYNQFLRGWLEKTPKPLVPALMTQIREEEEQEHSRLFVEMLAFLAKLAPGEQRFDLTRLDTLNYTFSRQCVEERAFGFFLGSFLATEMMAAKRYTQLLAGFRRLGVDERGLTFIHLHCGGEVKHTLEAKRDLILPLLRHEPAARAAIAEGVKDRLQRSGAYLKWYEDTQITSLGSPH